MYLCLFAKLLRRFFFSFIMIATAVHIINSNRLEAGEHVSLVLKHVRGCSETVKMRSCMLHVMLMIVSNYGTACQSHSSGIRFMSAF